MSIQGIRKIRESKTGALLQPYASAEIKDQQSTKNSVSNAGSLKRTSRLVNIVKEKVGNNLVRPDHITSRTPQTDRRKKESSNPNVKAVDFQAFLNQHIDFEQLTLNPPHTHRKLHPVEIGSSAQNERPDVKSHHENRISGIESKKQDAIPGFMSVRDNRAERKNEERRRTPSILTSRADSRQGKTQNLETVQRKLGRQNFNLDFVVGKGGFGKVWKVHEKSTGKVFAMKEMLKIKVIAKKSVSSIIAERDLLSRLHHPFVVNMYYAFQDKQTLYLVMDYLNGGDLRYHLGNRRKFSEYQSKFFVACIVQGLTYIHANKVIHRDLKPENLVFDDKGYLRITDFGISREQAPGNAADTSGTPGYMAPQVITKTDHSYPVDFFALGVIAYEMMLGKRPYVGRNRQEIRQHMLSKQVQIAEPPQGWTSDAIDFVNKLIQRKPQNRLGTNGIAEVKNHPWIRNFDWHSLASKTIRAPFIPLTIEQDFRNYQNNISEDTVIEDKDECELILRNPATQEMFAGYEYNSVKPILQIRKKKNSET